MERRAVVGTITAFRGEDEYAAQDDALVEITEVKSDRVELAFDLPRGLRVYVTVSLADVMREAFRPEREGE